LRVYNSERYITDLDALLVKANSESTLALTRKNAEVDLGIGETITPGLQKIGVPSTRQVCSEAGRLPRRPYQKSEILTIHIDDILKSMAQLE